MLPGAESSTSACVRGLGPPCFLTLITSWSSCGEWEDSAQFLPSIQKFFWSQWSAVFSPTRLYLVQALCHMFHLSAQGQIQSKYNQMHLLTKSSCPAHCKFDFDIRPLALWLHECESCMSACGIAWCSDENVMSDMFNHNGLYSFYLECTPFMTNVCKCWDKNNIWQGRWVCFILLTH